VVLVVCSGGTYVSIKAFKRPFLAKNTTHFVEGIVSFDALITGSAAIVQAFNPARQVLSLSRSLHHI
jgi:hypothetical protein